MAKRTPSVLAAILWLAAGGRTDNAALTSGGQPRMMDKHPSIVMASEAIRLTVHWNRVDADCTFVFHNTGKATKVRMGFPDFGLFAYAQAPAKGEKPQSMFVSYHSFVDDKAASTKLIRGANPGEQWQTKTVAFVRHASRTVREIYTTDVGGVSLQVPIAMASYILHTGASWKGPIGAGTVSVTFDPDSEVALPLKPHFYKRLFSQPVASVVEAPGGLICSGPSAPRVSGRTVTYRFTSLSPKQSDDILVGYRMSSRYIEWAKKQYGAAQGNKGKG